MLLSQLWRTPEDIEQFYFVDTYIFMKFLWCIILYFFIYMINKQKRRKSGKEDKERKKKRKSNNRTMRKRLEGSRNKNEREMKMSKIKK